MKCLQSRANRVVRESCLIELYQSYFLGREYLLIDENRIALQETEIVDLDAQLAARIEKMQTGNTTQTDLDLKQVKQVVVNMGEHGHHFRLSLETRDSEKNAFQVNIAFAGTSYAPPDLIAQGKKVGGFLNKSVILRHTDLGNPVTEKPMDAWKVHHSRRIPKWLK